MESVTDLQDAMGEWQEQVEEVGLFNAHEKEALLLSSSGLLTKLRGFKAEK